jgi:arginase family enzyme
VEKFMKFYDFGEVFNQQTKFVIFGIPWNDLTSIETANSSEAPERIRKVSSNLALTTELGIEIPKLDIVDVGDIDIKPHKIEKNIAIIEKFVDLIYNQKKDIIPISVHIRSLKQ